MLINGGARVFIGVGGPLTACRLHSMLPHNPCVLLPRLTTHSSLTSLCAQMPSIPPGGIPGPVPGVIPTPGGIPPGVTPITPTPGTIPQPGTPGVPPVTQPGVTPPVVPPTPGVVPPVIPPPVIPPVIPPVPGQAPRPPVSVQLYLLRLGQQHRACVLASRQHDAVSFGVHVKAGSPHNHLLQTGPGTRACDVHMILASHSKLIG